MLSILATCEENKCHFNTVKIFHIFVFLMKKLSIIISVFKCCQTHFNTMCINVAFELLSVQGLDFKINQLEILLFSIVELN